MGIDICLLDCEGYDEVNPKEMHSHQDRSHGDEGPVLEIYDVPVVLGPWNVSPHLRQNAERIDDCPEIDPREKHGQVGDRHREFIPEPGFDVSPCEGGEDVAGVVDDDDDDSGCDLVGEHGEEDERDGDAVVQQKLVILSITAADDEHQLKQRKEVDAHLHHEVMLHIARCLSVARPVRVL